MIEDKLVDDVLIYLDGWSLQNKSHKHRHKPQKFLEPFNETTDDIENTNVRKTVTTKDVLGMYEVAKIHALNYIKRSVYPRTPVTHVALCMWTAGLLAQKASFKEQKVEKSYNLINEAKKLLQPHINHTPKIMLVSGGDDLDDDYENYLIHKHKKRCPKKHHPCELEHPHHHKSHHHKPHHHEHNHYKCEEHKPHFEYDEPEYEDFFLKNNHVVIKLVPLYGTAGSKAVLKAYVRDLDGNRVNSGKIQFYLEDDEDIAFDY